MVAGLATALLAAQSVWERLGPLDRARLTMAALAFVVLFVGVIAFVVLMGRMAKREIRKPLPPVRDLGDAWARKPLNNQPTSPADAREEME
jgi:hypothetical protein